MITDLKSNHSLASNLIFIFITFFSFFGCKQKLVKVIARTKSGTPSVVFEYPDRSDTLSYTAKVYYPDGKLHKEASIRNGKYVGEKVTYFPSGVIRQVDSLSQPCDRLANACDGVLLRYNENGSISQRFEIKNGQINGLSKHYDDIGSLVKAYYLKDDSIKDGVYFEYYNNGSISRKASYRNDTLVGVEYFFNENGDTLKYYSHHEGQIDIPVKKWLQNGNVVYGTHFKGEIVLWRWSSNKSQFADIPFVSKCYPLVKDNSVREQMLVTLPSWFEYNLLIINLKLLLIALIKNLKFVLCHL